MLDYRVAIVEDDPQIFVELITMVEEESGFYVVGTAENGEEAYDMIITCQPDVVLLDIVMPNFDGFSLIKKINQNQTGKPYKMPAYIILTMTNCDQVATEAFKLGVDYYIVKPFYKEIVMDKIRKVYTEHNRFKRYENFENVNCNIDKPNYIDLHLESEIALILHEVGISTILTGYYYLRDGILFAVKEDDSQISVTKDLYPRIAQKYQTTSSHVERAIRHSIEVAWNQVKPDTIINVFGQSINTGKGRPTNSEFMALVSDKIRLDYDKNLELSCK